MNRLIKILILLVFFLFYYIIELKDILTPCLFKIIFSIECPMCGISRAIKQILDLNIQASFQYNLLAIPVFIFLIVNAIILVYDVIFSKKQLEKIYNYLGKYYLLILIVLILNMVINNLKSI